MGTYFLPRLRRSKDPNDRDLWFLGYSGGAYIAAKYGIIFGWRRLIVVDAIQPHTEGLHDR